MKRSWAVGSLALAMGLLVGCQSGKNHEDVKADFEKFKTNRPPVEAIVSGDKAIDNVAVASARLYQQTNKYLDEYVAATDNHQEFFEFTAIVRMKMENDKSMSLADARKAARADMVAADPNIWPKVKAGYDAAEALHPVNKLADIAQLLIEVAKVSQSAIGLKNSFNGFDATTIAKVNSVCKVLTQLTFTKDALVYLQRQYSAVSEAKSYMQ